MPPVGHLISHTDGPSGRQGVGYDYVLGRNGLYVQSASKKMRARIRIAAADVRGLVAVGEKLKLADGPIPIHLLALGLDWFASDPGVERYFYIHHSGGEYRIAAPEQTGNATSLTYSPPRSAVAEFHSHGPMRAFFSSTDDADEQGFRIYGVIGGLNKNPEMNLRIGVYGHFAPVRFAEVFSGAPPPGLTPLADQALDYIECHSPNTPTGESACPTR